MSAIFNTLSQLLSYQPIRTFRKTRNSGVMQDYRTMYLLMLMFIILTFLEVYKTARGPQTQFLPRMMSLLSESD